jgi:hypothetical protein
VKGGTHILVGCSDGDVFVFAVNSIAGDKVRKCNYLKYSAYMTPSHHLLSSINIVSNVGI